MRKSFLCFLCATAFLAPLSFAHAQGQTELTEDAIKKFYVDSTNAYKLPQQDYLAFLQKSMANNFESSTKITLNIPGRPAAKNVILDKKDSVLQNADKTYASMQGADMSNNVTRIDISVDHKRAKVEDQTTVKGMKPDPSSPIVMDGGGGCADDLTLTQDGDIQIVKSSCVTEFTVRQ